MSSEPIKGASPIATEKLIEVWQGFTHASDLLDGLTLEQAVTKLETWPYSVPEQVAHMIFWQRHALDENKEPRRKWTGYSSQTSSPAASGAVVDSAFPAFLHTSLSSLHHHVCLRYWQSSHPTRTLPPKASS